MQFRDGFNKETENVYEIFVQVSQKCYEDPASDYTSFRGRSISLTRALDWHARFRAGRKKARKVNGGVKSMLIISCHQSDCSEGIRPRRTNISSA
jgi:hypothetical protein